MVSFDEIIKNIVKGDGISLTIMGMGVVFIGLVVLFLMMLSLKKVIQFVEDRQDRAKTKKMATEYVFENNFDEIAAAVGLAFYLFKLKNSANQITIKRISRSSWKESLRARSMERL